MALKSALYLVFQVAETADTEVGLVARPEGDGGQPLVVDVSGAIGQAVRAGRLADVLVQVVEQHLGLPRVAEHLGVFLWCNDFCFDVFTFHCKNATLVISSSPILNNLFVVLACHYCLYYMSSINILKPLTAFL